MLYDTSGDSDININETILRTIEAEGGGIDTPRTVSPSPVASATATPTRVLSPVPSAVLDSSTDTRLSNISPDRQSIENKLSDMNLNSGANPTAQVLQKVDTQSMAPAVVSKLHNVNGEHSLNNNVTSVDRRNNDVSKASAIQNNRRNMKSEVERFKVPNVGEYLDVHVNFIHDPSNFVVRKYLTFNNDDGKV